MITNKSPISQRYKNKDQQKLRQIKFYKNPQTKFDVDIYLYGNKHIAFINYQDMSALTIQSQEVYQMMKTIFMSNWEAL